MNWINWNVKKIIKQQHKNFDYLLKATNVKKLKLNQLGFL